MRTSLWVIAALLMVETSAIVVKQREIEFDENLLTEEQEAKASLAFNKIAETYKNHMKENENLIKDYNHSIS